jgi:hypothetical protein
MTSRTGAPLAIALAVLLVVLGIIGATRLTGSSDDSAGTSPGGDVSSGDISSPAVVPPTSGTGSPSPVAPAPDPASTSRFTTVTAGAGGKSVDVKFWGGVDDCYRYTVRAQETPDAVSLMLVEKRTFDGACIELAQEYEKTVPLDAPLGTRSVVDATTDVVLLAPSP